MKITSVYIAARYSRKEEMRTHAAVLRSHGIRVTSSWLDENNPADTQMGDDSPDFYRHHAQVDLCDIYNAQVLLFFSEDPLVGIPRGGRHVELGYALGIHRPICVIGYKENIFHYLPRVRHFETVEQFIQEAAK